MIGMTQSLKIMKALLFLYLMQLCQNCLAQSTSNEIFVSIEKLHSGWKFQRVGDTVDLPYHYFENDSCFGAARIILLDSVGSYTLTIWKDYQKQPETYYYGGRAAAFKRSPALLMSPTTGKFVGKVYEKLFTPSLLRAEIPKENIGIKRPPKVYIEKLDDGRRFHRIGDSACYNDFCLVGDSCYGIVSIYSTDSVGSYKMVCINTKKRYKITYYYKGDRTRMGMISDFHERDYDKNGNTVIRGKEFMYVPKLVRYEVSPM